MSTAAAPAVSREPRAPRGLPRFNVAVPLDVSVLRSGIPDRIPGRSVDISDRGLGLVVAGELLAGEPVAVEFWLPQVEQPVKARAVVRHQFQLRCGLEFLGLSSAQQSLIHTWTQQQIERQSPPDTWVEPGKRATKERSGARQRARRLSQKIQQYRLRIALLLLLAASLGWWRWQRGWRELEAQLPAQQVVVQPQLMVAAAEMEQRITHKVDPVYPEEARQGHLHGVVVLHVVVGSDGTVMRLERVRGPEILAQAAMEAVRWWRYEPYVLNGRPIDVETTLEVPFNDYRVSMKAD